MDRFHSTLLIVAAVTTLAAMIVVVIRRSQRSSPKPRPGLRSAVGILTGAALSLWILVPVFRTWPGLADRPLTIAFLVALLANLAIIVIGGREARRASVAYNPTYPIAMLQGVVLAVLLARGVFLFSS